MNGRYCALLFVVLLLSACVQQENPKPEESVSIDVQPQEMQRLGSLCTGEEECTAFCQNNKGRCSTYCTTNPENSLCQNFAGFSEPGQNQAMENTACVNNKKPVFTQPFTDLSKIGHIAPLGNIKAGSQSRSYVFIKTDADGKKFLVPIYAPTDATVFGIVYAYRGKSQDARAEYRGL